MLSVIIVSAGDGQKLARTLMSVFPAIAEGVVRDGFVLAVDQAGEDERIADAAGCEFVSGPLGQSSAMVLDRVRADYVLFLLAGAELEADWWREAAQFVERSGHGNRRSAAFAFATHDYGLAARLAEWGSAARSRLLGRADPRQGMIAHKDLIRNARGAGRFPPRPSGRMILLRSRAFAPQDA